MHEAGAPHPGGEIVGMGRREGGRQCGRERMGEAQGRDRRRCHFCYYKQLQVALFSVQTKQVLSC